MEVRGLIWMMGEGSPGDWFSARNSGRKRREKDPSGSNATLEGKTLRACTSLHLRLEVRATKTVFRVRNFSEISRMGLYGARCREESTRKWSQDGVRLGFLVSLTDAERTRSRRRGSSDRDGPPSWRRVVQMAAWWTLIENAERERSVERCAKKLATWIREGLQGSTWLSWDQWSQWDQWEE